AGLGISVVGDVYDADYHRTEVEPLLGPGEWIGPVARRTLSGIMAASRVLIMPIGWEEPFGLVAAEAQMAGCPVVAYRRGAMSEVVAHGIGGWLVEPDDEAALLLAVMRSSELDRPAIRAHAERELGIEPMISAYEVVLRSVASGWS